MTVKGIVPDTSKQDPCCIGPCDPPWREEGSCFSYYETRYLQIPLGKQKETATQVPPDETAAGERALFSRLALPYIRFRITYEHKLCLIGKGLGPLVYTQTLLPGEKLTLYHSDRYRQITTAQERYSVQTTFYNFLSIVQQAQASNAIETLHDQLSTSSASGGGGGSVGLDLGFFAVSLGGGGQASSTNTDHNVVQTQAASNTFNQSVQVASQLTQAERSVVVSTYQEQDSANVSVRLISNDNACHAVTYFVRRVMDLYALSTVVYDISYQILASGVPADWHALGDVAWLPQAVRDQIAAELKLLPKTGDAVERPKSVAIPTDGTVYDAELAHCCSCEPEREAAIKIQLEKQKADAHKAVLEAQLLELEIERRKALLAKGDLSSPLAPAPAPAPATPASLGN